MLDDELLSMQSKIIFCLDFFPLKGQEQLSIKKIHAINNEKKILEKCLTICWNVERGY